MAVLGIAIFLACLAGSVAIQRAMARSRRMIEPEVQITDAGIVAVLPTGATVNLAWSALTKVSLRTTADGPFAPDVFWIVHAGSSAPALVLPGNAAGTDQLLRALQERLPGFRNELFIEAMGSVSERLFVLWEPPGPA